MRRHLKKTAEGYFTVEAAALFPLLIFLTFLLIYMVIFVYDKTLMIQDMNSLVASVRLSERDFYYDCKEITEEHPYISTNQLIVEISEQNSKYLVTVRSKWKFPLHIYYDKELEESREIKVINPCRIMLLTEGLIIESEETNHDKDEGD